MARRVTRITRKTKPKKTTVRVGKKGIAIASSGNTLTKDFRPKDADVFRYGPEPSFSEHQPETDNLTDTYNWYSKFCTHKDAKQFIVDYLIASGAKKELISQIRRCPDNRTVTTAGWVARCHARGLVLSEQRQNFLNNSIQEMVSFGKAGLKDDDSEDEVETPKRKVNVHQVMMEKVDEAFCDVEELVDTFLENGFTKDSTTGKKVIGFLESRNLLPHHVSPKIALYEKQLDELKLVQAGTDEDLNEGYRHMSKMQVRYAISFYEELISEMHGYISMRQVAKKPRAKKPVPIEKIVKSLKYLKNFKDGKLDLTSVSPQKLHQSTEAWVYDTAKRRLYHFIADDFNKCLIVKGNTILGFDKKESGSKNIRKPEEFLLEFCKVGRPARRKMFTDVKSVQAVPNGRFNDKMVILFAY